MRRWLLVGSATVLVAGGAIGANALPRTRSVDTLAAPATAAVVAQRAVTIGAAADATLDGAAPTTGTGAAPTLEVAASPRRDALLRIDLTAARRSTETVLRLHPDPPLVPGAGIDLDVAWLSDVAWDEATVTAATAPVVDGAERRVHAAVGADGWLSVDLTGVVGGGAPITLRLRSTGEPLVVDARESSSPPQVVAHVGVPADDSTVRVWAVGDLACPGDEAFAADACHQWAVSNLLAADPSLDAFLALGDLQYPAGALTDYLTGYAPSYGRLLDLTLPTPGNHDWLTSGAAGYRAYFGASAHAETGGWYSVDLGASWHVVVLDSDCSDVGCASGSAQERWLRADLAASTRPCTIAVWHHPRFSSGQHHGVDADVRAFWQALVDDGAEIVVNGHDHVYERFHRQTADGVVTPAGVRQFTVGTGGRSLYAFGAPLPSSSVRLATFGALRLDLSATGYAWAFVDETGAVLDSGTGSCA